MTAGIGLYGNEGVMCVWLGENESNQDGLIVHNKLTNLSVYGTQITCADNLSGFSDSATPFL